MLIDFSVDYGRFPNVAIGLALEGDVELLSEGWRTVMVLLPMEMTLAMLS